MDDGIRRAVRVLLNCAVSQDGHIAGPDGRPTRLSDDEDLRRVHALRAGCDAILVGVGTVVADDPSLQVKPDYAVGQSPVRVVLDTHGRIPPGSRVLDGAVTTLVFHADGEPQPGAEWIRVPASFDGVDLNAVLRVLEERGIESLMVEGGAGVLAAFLRSGLWDEWTVYEAPVHLGGGPALPRPAKLKEWGVEELSSIARGEGWLKSFGPG